MYGELADTIVVDYFVIWEAAAPETPENCRHLPTEQTGFP